MKIILIVIISLLIICSIIGLTAYRTEYDFSLRYVYEHYSIYIFSIILLLLFINIKSKYYFDFKFYKILFAAILTLFAIVIISGCINLANVLFGKSENLLISGQIVEIKKLRGGIRFSTHFYDTIVVLDSVRNQKYEFFIPSDSITYYQNHKYYSRECRLGALDILYY